MKNLAAILLCLLAAASLAGCGGTADKSADTTAQVQIPSPFTDCATLADAAKGAGFEMTAPDTLDGYPERTIQVADREMIQVIFENEAGSVTLRKAAGSDDVSGDYNDYGETGTRTVGNLTVSTRGENGLVNVATWTDGGYTFAITVSGTGLSAAAADALVQSMG